MTKTKVYLSKSNAGDSASYTKVRAALEEWDIEIVECQPGNYDESLVKQCDYLVIVPPGMIYSSPPILGYLTVGKGQDALANTFTKMNKADKILIATAIGMTTVYFNKLSYPTTIDKNWTTQYARFFLEDGCKRFDLFTSVARKPKFKEVEIDLNDYTTQDGKTVAQLRDEQKLMNTLTNASRGKKSDGSDYTKQEALDLLSKIGVISSTEKGVNPGINYGTAGERIPKEVEDMFYQASAEDAAELILINTIRKNLTKVGSDRNEKPLLALAA